MKHFAFFWSLRSVNIFPLLVFPSIKFHFKENSPGARSAEPARRPGRTSPASRLADGRDRHTQPWSGTPDPTPEPRALRARGRVATQLSRGEGQASRTSLRLPTSSVSRLRRPRPVQTSRMTVQAPKRVSTLHTPRGPPSCSRSAVRAAFSPPVHAPEGPQHPPQT